MPETELYQVTIRWSEKTEDSNFVKLTRRQAGMVDHRLKQAMKDEEIDGFSVEPAGPRITTYEQMVEWIRTTPLHKYFGPKEWIPEEEKRKPWPFIEISDARLICTHCGVGGDLAFPADEQGAVELGHELANRKIKKWLYSSSVDFPDEYGAPNLDFRSIIETAAGLDVSEDRPW